MSTVPIPQSKSGNSIVDNLFNFGFGIYAYEDFKDASEKQRRLLTTPTTTRPPPAGRGYQGIDPTAQKIGAVIGIVGGCLLGYWLVKKTVG